MTVIQKHAKCRLMLDFRGFPGGGRRPVWAAALGLILIWPHAAVTAAGDLPPTAVANAPASGPAGGEFMAGEILVKFKPGVSAGEIERINEALGASVLEYIEGIGVYRLSVPSTRTLQELLDIYGQDPRVEYAEPNYMGRGGDFVPDDTFFGDQWYLHNEGQTGGTVDADIDAVEGWQLSRGSSAVIVAVLDTGVERDHPEFQGRSLQGFDFVNEDGDPEADHPHGVLVTGILAANSNDGFAGAGVDHNATILPVKVLDQDNAGTTADLIQGLIYAAEQGADVINMSLINYPLTAALNDALQVARDAGSILIACAGNGGIGDADVSGPGASPLTISIGATDHDDARAGFSGTGAALDLVAPGLDLPTAVFGSDADQVTLFSGCSAATPVAAGIAALLLSADPSLTHDAIRSILTETAEDQVGPAAEDTPGRDDFFGFGRVNLHDALTSFVRQVAADIRPRQCPNRVHANSRGSLPVAVAGTDRFDVREIDPGSIRLAGVPPQPGRTRLRDVTTPFEPFVGRESASDCTRAGADGFEDLLMRFSQRRVVRALGTVADKELVLVPLTGALEDGTPIIGEDVVVVFKPRRWPGRPEQQVSSRLEDGAEFLAGMQDR